MSDKKYAMLDAMADPTYGWKFVLDDPNCVLIATRPGGHTTRIDIEKIEDQALRDVVYFLALKVALSPPQESAQGVAQPVGADSLEVLRRDRQPPHQVP